MLSTNIISADSLGGFIAHSDHHMKRPMVTAWLQLPVDHLTWTLPDVDQQRTMETGVVPPNELREAIVPPPVTVVLQPELLQLAVCLGVGLPGGATPEPPEDRENPSARDVDPDVD